MITFVKICIDMARDFKQQLDSVSAKLLVLSERYHKLDESYRAARAEITELKATLLAHEREIDRLKVDNEYLTVASTVGGNRENREAVRALIADLVRDIDRCITDLLE